jgi:hypothetical protein
MLFTARVLLACPQVLQLCAFVRGDQVDLSTFTKVVAATYTACKVTTGAGGDSSPSHASEPAAAWQWSGLLSTQAKASR